MRRSVLHYDGACLGTRNDVKMKWISSVPQILSRYPEASNPQTIYFILLPFMVMLEQSERNFHPKRCLQDTGSRSRTPGNDRASVGSPSVVVACSFGYYGSRMRKMRKVAVLRYVGRRASRPASGSGNGCG